MAKDTHLFQCCQCYSCCNRNNYVSVSDVLRDLIENRWNQVRFNCYKDHIWPTDHLHVGVSDGNPQLLKANVGGTLLTHVYLLHDV